MSSKTNEKYHKLGSMTTIIWNNIEKEIKLRHPGHKTRQLLLTRSLGELIYEGREKTWTRILNNSSQPTLDELSVIARELGKPMDDLVEFSKAKTA